MRPARQSLVMPVVSPERPHVEYWPGVAARLLKVGSVEPQGRGEEELQRRALVSRVDKPVEVEWAALGGGEPLVLGGVQGACGAPLGRDAGGGGACRPSASAGLPTPWLGFQTG